MQPSFYALMVFGLRMQSSEAAEWLTGKTTRYWDCCKPSCAWPGKFRANSSLKVCGADGEALAEANAPNACPAGAAVSAQAGPLSYSCQDSGPFYDEASNTSYLFAAASIAGMVESDTCCACFELVFDMQTRAGRVVVQVTNTGADLSENHFDLQIPGGGFGLYDACSANGGPLAQFPSTPTTNWGSQYGGLLAAGFKDSTGCLLLPLSLQSGCRWFYERFEAMDSPSMKFTRIECPLQITQVSGCTRQPEEEHQSSVLVMGWKFWLPAIGVGILLLCGLCALARCLFEQLIYCIENPTVRPQRIVKNQESDTD